MSRSPASILYDSSGNAVAVTLDGGVYRLEMIGKVRDSSGTLVDPATEGTLATRASEATLASLDGKDFATETTLDAFSTAFSSTDFATETTLSSCDSSLSSIDSSIDVALSTRATAAAQTDGSQLSQVVDSAGDGLEIDASGRAAIQNQPNMDVALSTRATEATLSAADTKLGTIDGVLDSIKDTDGIKKITDQLPAGSNQIGAVSQGTKGAGSNAWPTVIYDGSGNPVTITEDAGVYRVEISGKVTVVGASPPPSTNEFFLFADSPLTTGDNTTSKVVPNGETFHLQTFRCGNEDPTKGAVFEIFFNDGTQHLVARFYANGETVEFGFADVTAARDGTVMVGNGSNTIQVRRAKFSGSNIAMDAVLRGYTV